MSQVKAKYLLLINPLSAELNPICHLRALLGTHLILHVSRLRVKYHCMRMCEGMEMHVHAFNLVLVGLCYSLWPLYSQEEKRMCPRVGLGVVHKRKISAALTELSPAMLTVVGRRGRVILGLVLQLRKYGASRPLCMS